MVTAMGRHAENAKVQEQACGALTALAMNLVENRAKAGEIKAQICAQVDNRHEYI